MSSGKTGKTSTSVITAGTPYAALVVGKCECGRQEEKDGLGGGRGSVKKGRVLIHVKGVLADLLPPVPIDGEGDSDSGGGGGGDGGTGTGTGNDDDPLDIRALAQFVVERPHKFLVQRSSGKASKGAARTLAYSPELGAGARFAAEGVMRVDTGGDAVRAPILSVLSSIGVDPGVALASLDRAVCLLQPDYVLVDHINIVVSSEC